jgi:branched-chain amino acid transport system ATP-binding protein
MTKIVLETSSLCAFYDARQVLFDLDLAIRRGSVTALLGANGAGKTTLLRALTGMVRTSGSIRFCGRDITNRTTETIARLKIAHIPQGRGTFLSLTVSENLRVGAITRRDHAGIQTDIDRVFTCFPRLKERQNQRAGTLSGGEQQMLAIGRALMLRPELMLLDEASFGLAPMVVREMFEILQKLNQDEKISMLIVEQNAALAMEMADEVYLLETGRFVMQGTARELRSNKAVQAAYLGY